MMKKGFTPINFTKGGMDVCTLAGTMASHSTQDLHAHGHHQVLRINSGVTLLVDAQRRQPMFGALTAFIPADFPHRSVVLGSPVHYKSIYLAKTLIPCSEKKIRLFFISPLGAALYDRIQVFGAQDLERNLNRECLDLLLKLLPEEMAHPVGLVRLPEPKTNLIRKVVNFVEKRYADPLSMAAFSNALPYSERHLARVFKQEMRITLFEYVRLYRILMASLALCEADTAVTQIALDCGYASLSSFYRDFNRVYGVPPKFFRETFLAANCPA
jgi:AraC-like DNA-binding protein